MRSVTRRDAPLLPRARPQATSRRSRPRSRRRSLWRLKPLLLVTLGLIIASVIGWGVASGRFRDEYRAARLAFVRGTATIGFSVREIVVEGRHETPEGTLLAALGARRGTPILFFNTAAAAARIERIGWVKTATVARRLPNEVLVRLVERQPFARWQIDGRIEVVDQDGTVLPGAKPGNYRALRLIVGQGAAPRAAPLFSMLMSEPALFRRVVAATWVGDRRWNLRLANGVAVELPEHHADAAWLHLANLERRQGLLEKAVTVVDMRLADRVTLELQPGAKADFDGAGTRAGSGRG